MVSNSDSLPEEWAILAFWLPANLDALAREHGFTRRARGLQDPSLWLRLILMHHGWFVFQGLALEPALQDGFDARVEAGAEMQGSHAGGLDPLGTEGFAQPHDAQT